MCIVYFIFVYSTEMQFGLYIGGYMEFLLDQILIIRSFIYLFHQYFATNIAFL